MYILLKVKGKRKYRKTVGFLGRRKGRRECGCRNINRYAEKKRIEKAAGTCRRPETGQRPGLLLYFLR